MIGYADRVHRGADSAIAGELDRSHFLPETCHVDGREDVVGTRTLVVEDEVAIAAWARRVFEGEGWTVDVAVSGADAIARVSEGSAYNLILLDLGLPDQDGLALLEEWRQGGNTTPIVIMSGRGLDADVTAGLDAGADDFVVKPVSAAVLLSHARAVLRRAPPPEGEEIRLGEVVLELASRRVRGPQGHIPLTAREYELLQFLMQHASQIVPRADILKRVWGYDFDPGTNVADVALSRLRHKLSAASSCLVLRTVRNMGVILEPDVTGFAGAKKV